MAKVLPFRRRATGSWDADMRKAHNDRILAERKPPTCHDDVTWYNFEANASDRETADLSNVDDSVSQGEQAHDDA